MQPIRPINSDLCFFRLALAWRRDDFVDGSGHGGAWVFYNSRSIQVQFRYAGGLAHTRLSHFLLDVGSCRVGRFLAFLVQHPSIMTSRGKQCCPISHSFLEYGTEFSRSIAVWTLEDRESKPWPVFTDLGRLLRG